MVINASINADGISKAAVWAGALTGQIEYAASRALNDAAKAASDDLNRSTTTYFDRPTLFTTRGYYVSRYSNKRSLEAELNLRPIQARYLTPSIVGGVRPQRPSERKAQGIAAWRPGRSARISQATGNISKAEATKALQGGPNYFRLDKRQGKLRPGIYRRMAGGAIKNILAFNALPNIPKRWPVERIADDSIAKHWPGRLNYWIERAMKG